MTPSPRKIFAALAATVACLLPLPSKGQNDSELLQLQNDLRREIAARCLPQFDGDKRKGELTNADLPALLDAKGLYNLWPSEGLLDGHARDAFAGLVSQRYVVCIDSRMKGLRDATGQSISAVFFLGTAKESGKDYRPVRVIAISPHALDAKHPKESTQVVLIDAAQHIRHIHRTLPKAEGVNADDVYHLPVGIGAPLPDFNSIAKWRPVVADPAIVRQLPTAPARPLY